MLSNASASTAWLLSAAFPVSVLVLSIIFDPLGTPQAATASNQTQEDADSIPLQLQARVRDTRAQSVLQSILDHDATTPASNPFRYRPGDIYDNRDTPTATGPTGH